MVVRTLYIKEVACNQFLVNYVEPRRDLRTGGI